ncbi:unnamed protein product, partial [Meganyctiphanes norvegica]
VLKLTLLLISVVLGIVLGHAMIFKKPWFLAPHLVFHTVAGYIGIMIMMRDVPFSFFLFIMLNFIHLFLIVVWNKEYFSKMEKHFTGFMILVIVFAALGVIGSIVVDGRLAKIRHLQRTKG